MKKAPCRPLLVASAILIASAVIMGCAAAAAPNHAPPPEPAHESPKLADPSPAGRVHPEPLPANVSASPSGDPDQAPMLRQSPGKTLETGAIHYKPVNDDFTTGHPGHSSVAAARGHIPPAQTGATYTWHDGNRVLTVSLQTDLTIDRGRIGASEHVSTNTGRDNLDLRIDRGRIGASEHVSTNTGQGNIVSQRHDPDALGAENQPVFRSPSGALMTLPGGVLLILTSDWDQTQTTEFFAQHGITSDRVSPLDYVTNGFFVQTLPGFPSLELANHLAQQQGVEVSSPNWWTEVATE